jgi:hypothetical protein
MRAVKTELAPTTEFLRWTRFARIVQSHSGKSGVRATFLLANAERVKAHAQAMAEKHGRLPKLAGASGAWMPMA